MHYYQFNIGSYHRRAHYLDNDQDLAYRRLMDIYYLDESPLPNDIPKLARKVRMSENPDAVAVVLNDFFTLESDGFWHNDKCDKEIATYQKIKNGGAEGGKKRAENQRLGNPPLTPPSKGLQATNNQEPVTNNQSYIKPIVLKPAHEEKKVLKKSGYGGQEGVRIFDPSEKTQSEIFSNCRGWNLQTLLCHYENYRREHGEPNYPQAAFVAWAKRFTKGRPPA